MGTAAMLFFAFGCQGGAALQLTVDASRDVHPISPYIYGANPSDWTGRWKVSTFTRIGGNRLTAYNWETNASNAGADWYNQNDGYLGGGDVPLGAFMPTINAAVSHGAPMLMTLQMAGYVAADKKGDGDVGNTPDYLDVRFNKCYSTSPSGTDLTAPPNLTDHKVFEDQMIAHVLKERVRGAPVWWELDNEPDIWHSTHSRIVLKPITYTDLIDRSIDFTKMIKRVDPDSLIFGWASYGWNGYTTLQNAPDGAGRYFLEYYLDHMKAAGQSVGKRLLDVLDLHYYSEARGDGHRVTENINDPGLIAARVQSTRSLYDPTYVEDSWITAYSTHGPINLLPRIQASISKCYPGTKLAITEYNFGGEDISCGLAEADALGAFGREGVFAAAIWPVQGNVSFLQAALELYRNYDGGGSHFGDTSIFASSPDLAKVSLWASQDSKAPGKTVLVAINRSTSEQAVSIQLKNIHANYVRYFRLQGSDSNISAVGSGHVSGGRISATLPAMSATVVELTNAGAGGGGGRAEG